LAPLIRIRTPAGEEALDLEEFESRARRGEIAGHYQVCFPPVTGEGWVRTDQLELFRRLQDPRKLYFARAFNLGRFPTVTAVFVILDIALYLMMGLGRPVEQDALVAWGAKVAPLMLDLGQLWRLVTANLLHQNALHIAFNLFILFNVGGALENAYRRLDYAMLLAASALGTTSMSVFARPDAVSAGASGIVYGALGAAVVFGIKYRELLPQRYRRVLGESTIPIVLVFLYIGFTSSGVDNWAHLGGLLAGALAALFMTPRLLVEASPSIRSSLLRSLPLLGAGAAVLLGGLWLQWRPVRLQPSADDLLGLEVAAPPLWWMEAEGAGFLTVHNGLSGLGRASLSVRVEPLGEDSVEQVIRGWIDQQLLAEERAGALTEVTLGAPVASALAGVGATRLEGSYTEDGTTTRFRAYFVPRGELVYEVVYQWSAEYPAYERVIERMERAVRLVEPRSLREARGRALVAPGRGTFEALGETLGQLGEHQGAAAAFAEAVARAPGESELQARLARHLLASGQTEAGCRSAARALEAAPSGAPALEAQGRCALARGERREALDWLRRALEADPDQRSAKALLESLVPPTGD
jgi:rhomboid protease GluP